MRTITCTLHNNSSNIKFINKDELFTGSEKAREKGQAEKQSVTVFDENTALLFDHMPKAHIVLPAGEEYKGWESVETILGRGVEEQLGRDGLFRGVGGGVVCDMTAFAASIYMRGVGCILVPTTLLAMVDAAVGGKTGIDFMGYKNMVGSFYPAREVRVCLETLQTLPEDVYMDGMAEVIKHALLKEPELLHLLETKRDDVLNKVESILAEIVYKAVKVKVDIVQQDFKEEGIRAHLNLGHTFAHALESVTGFREWSHGQAVAWGMNKAMETGVELGITDRDYARRVKKLLQSYDYELRCGVRAEELLRAMKYDKKKRGGEVRFVLQTSLGKTIVRRVDTAVLKKVLSL